MLDEEGGEEEMEIENDIVDNSFHNTQLHDNHVNEENNKKESCNIDQAISECDEVESYERTNALLSTNDLNSTKDKNDDFQQMPSKQSIEEEWYVLCIYTMYSGVNLNYFSGLLILILTVKTLI